MQLRFSVKMALVAALAVFGTNAQAQVPHGLTAPKVGIATFTQLEQPLPFPYNEDRNALAAVAKARAQALHEHKRLLIDLGGNWCLDCRTLAGTMRLPEVAAFVRAHYVFVAVNIGRYDMNMDVPSHYGMKHLDGVPALLVIDPARDALLNKAHIFALADARSMSPQALADYLATWAK
jgi:thiol-disulfide isomerase/thioredoxin